MEGAMTMFWATSSLVLMTVSALTSLSATQCEELRDSEFETS